MGELNVIDFFCGCGGLSYGFEKAGFNVTFGIDNDESAAKTFEFNHSSCLTSDDKQAKQLSVVGLCLNSITFFSLARLQLKQRCLIGNKALLTSCAVTTPMWFRA